MTLICGIYNRHDEPVGESSLDPMLDSMSNSVVSKHYWNEGPIALACIQHMPPPPWDTQPQAVPHRKNKKLLVADARLDQLDELWGQFENPTPDNPRSDAQTLSHALEQKGNQFIPKIAGEFALAHWDGECETLTLARDEFGLRPLYIHVDDKQIVFASEAAAVAAISGRKPNLETIAKLSLPMGALQTPNTSCFSNIEAVPAGTTLSFTKTKIASTHWVRPFSPVALPSHNDQDIIDGLKSLLTTVTADKLRDCSHAGVLLSGGLDSTTVAAYAKQYAKEHGTKLTFFASVSAADTQKKWPDESPWIDQAAKALDVDVVRIAAADKGPFNGIETEIAHAGFPLLTSRHYMYTAFTQACRERDIDLILDGLGGEFGPSFHGNGCLTEWLLTGRWIRFQREARMLAKTQQRHVLGVIRSQVLRPMLGALMHMGLGLSSPEGFGAWEKHSLIKTDFISDQLGDALSGYKDMQAALSFDVLTPRAHQLRNLQNLRGQQSPALPSWRHLHYAYPLADRRVLEYCLAAPSRLKLHNGFTRYLIRAAMPDCIPDNIRWRTSKKHFSPDYQRRYNAQRSYAREFIGAIDKDSAIAGVIDLDALMKLLDSDMENAKPKNAADFAAMHNVTRAVYLAAFLKSCPDWD